jgi:hypothetical protein
MGPKKGGYGRVDRALALTRAARNAKTPRRKDAKQQRVRGLLKGMTAKCPAVPPGE